MTCQLGSISRWCLGFWVESGSETASRWTQWEIRWSSSNGYLRFRTHICAADLNLFVVTGKKACRAWQPNAHAAVEDELHTGHWCEQRGWGVWVSVNNTVKFLERGTLLDLLKFSNISEPLVPLTLVNPLIWNSGSFEAILLHFTVSGKTN